MNKDLLITIIIPLYNKEKYFKRCFNSVVKQSYGNIECVIVDDCSTDGSLDLAEYLINSYTGNINFFLLKHRENGGLSVARNTGIDNSTGDYLFFLDADDEITEICIFSLVYLANKYHGVDMVQGNTLRPGHEFNFLDAKGKLPEYISGNNEIKLKYSNVIPETTWNKLIKKDFIIQNLYFKKNIIHEDNHWKFFYLKKIETFAFTDEYTYIWHTVEDSIMSNPNFFDSINAFLIIIEDFICNLDFDLMPQQLKSINNILIREKKRILSDNKYLSLLPKCESLINKLYNQNNFLNLAIRYENNLLKKILLRIIRKLF